MKRNGNETKEEAQRVALELFIAKGFEATSLREIAEEIGISKAALYYHFNSKEDIVKSIVSARSKEVTELLNWVRNQDPASDLLERTVLRWIETTSVEKLRGIRFVNANPAVMRNMSTGIGENLGAVAELVTGKGSDPTRKLMVRMVFLSINSAVMAAEGTQQSDEEIVAASREMALALLDRLREC
ncbi:TetR/AcrR family transcriptional regulator [Peribacillus loiseleuriae]|uniref:HTH tetR-type domain-containing protein n=1 Tax=Peribacillus loiseleuriae TaxID=1679170 RepID=A0A0K9GUV6_9BACI|nr:TetR/AcrR family transcriptional regulator [Peribacillus loiseleuriae]KMY50007.1 hypothetical protein AC625_11200 [Peribacillus loiseleuriae]